jgi:hypothetical protein
MSMADAAGPPPSQQFAPLVIIAFGLSFMVDSASAGSAGTFLSVEPISGVHVTLTCEHFLPQVS